MEEYTQVFDLGRDLIIDRPISETLKDTKITIFRCVVFEFPLRVSSFPPQFISDYSSPGNDLELTDRAEQLRALKVFLQEITHLRIEAGKRQNFLNGRVNRLAASPYWGGGCIFQ